MEKPQILLVERHRSAHQSFAAALKKRYTVISVMSGKQALVIAESLHPAALIVDAISLNSPGDRIVRMLKSEQSEPVIHLAQSLERSDADVLLNAPVSTRKLNATLDRLIAPLKTNAHDALIVGPFHMDIVRRVLVVDDKQTQLTPKLALLVEVFLRNPGATLDRKQLMERVWQTDYLGDTRTLDVHIRWIRRAIEADPAHPRYLKTVRGIGYRLELPAPAVALPARETTRSRK
ncbi:MAG TPA: response regulator transcription factor [Candidatus Limnocylindrales bacterium]|nr:response regulator transcription factor [Candidatus Limnocylindrales bacterium]